MWLYWTVDTWPFSSVTLQPITGDKCLVFPTPPPPQKEAQTSKVRHRWLGPILSALLRKKSLVIQTWNVPLVRSTFFGEEEKDNWQRLDGVPMGGANIGRSVGISANGKRIAFSFDIEHREFGSYNNAVFEIEAPVIPEKANTNDSVA